MKFFIFALFFALIAIVTTFAQAQGEVEPTTPTEMWFMMEFKLEDPNKFYSWIMEDSEMPEDPFEKCMIGVSSMNMANLAAIMEEFGTIDPTNLDEGQMEKLIKEMLNKLKGVKMSIYFKTDSEVIKQCSRKMIEANFDTYLPKGVYKLVTYGQITNFDEETCLDADGNIVCSTETPELQAGCKACTSPNVTAYSSNNAIVTSTFAVLAILALALF